MDLPPAIGHPADGDQPGHDPLHHPRARVRVGEEPAALPLHVVEEALVLHLGQAVDRRVRVAVEAAAARYGDDLEVPPVKEEGGGEGGDDDGTGAR